MFYLSLSHKTIKNSVIKIHEDGPQNEIFADTRIQVQIQKQHPNQQGHI